MFIRIDEYNGGGSLHGRVVSKHDGQGIDKKGDHGGLPHYGGGWTLSREFHDMLIERGIEYRLHWSRVSSKGHWEIEILNPLDVEVMDEVIFLKMKYG